MGGEGDGAPSKLSPRMNGSDVYNYKHKLHTYKVVEIPFPLLNQ